MKAVRSCCDAIRLGLSGRALLGLLLALAAFGVECAPAVEASADASRDLIRNYGPADGFSQNAVNAIVQGRDGYLWLGTFGGLVRFIRLVRTQLLQAQPATTRWLAQATPSANCCGHSSLAR